MMTTAEKENDQAQKEKAAAKKAGRPSPWYSCSWPDYVGDIICNHSRAEPCVPLHAIAETCDSARLWDDGVIRPSDSRTVLGLALVRPQHSCHFPGSTPA